MPYLKGNHPQALRIHEDYQTGQQDQKAFLSAARTFLGSQQQPTTTSPQSSAVATPLDHNTLKNNQPTNSTPSSMTAQSQPMSSTTSIQAPSSSTTQTAMDRKISPQPPPPPVQQQPSLQPPTISSLTTPHQFIASPAQPSIPPSPNSNPPSSLPISPFAFHHHPSNGQPSSSLLFPSSSSAPMPLSSSSGSPSNRMVSPPLNHPSLPPVHGYPSNNNQNHALLSSNNTPLLPEQHSPPFLGSYARCLFLTRNGFSLQPRLLSKRRHNPR